MLPQRSKHPREMVITPKASTSIFRTDIGYEIAGGEAMISFMDAIVS